jgi:Ca-activated chloride channel family protein
MKDAPWMLLLLSLTLGCGQAAAPPEAAAPRPAASAGREPAPLAIAVDPAPPPAETDARGSDDGGIRVGAEATSRYLPAGDLDQPVAIWVSVPAPRRAQRLPAAVALTVDSSGSMAGEKMVHAQQAAHTILDVLADGDLVTLHEFSESVRVLSASTLLDGVTRPRLARAVASLGARGNTNLFDAVRLAVAEAARAPGSHPVRRVIVVSDGRPTLGPGSPEVLGQIAEDGLRDGVQITALGIGLDYDERTLNALAQRSSGRTYHLDRPGEMAGIIQSELDDLRVTVATAAVLEIVPAPGVSIQRMVGVPAFWASGGALRVPIGALTAGQEREFLVRVRVRPGWQGEHALVSVRLHYVDPRDGGLSRVQETVVRCTITDDADRVSRSVNLRARAVVSTFRAADLTEQASRAADSGQLHAADGLLAQAETELEQPALRAAPPGARQRLTRSADRVGKARRALSEAQQAPAPARAAAARSNALRLNDAAMDLYGY